MSVAARWCTKSNSFSTVDRFDTLKVDVESIRERVVRALSSLGGSEMILQSNQIYDGGFKKLHKKMANTSAAASPSIYTESGLTRMRQLVADRLPPRRYADGFSKVPRVCAPPR